MFSSIRNGRTESPLINASRVAARVMKGGHDVPIPKIISRYTKSILNCAAVSPFCDRTYIYDNSIDGREAQLLFRMSDGIIKKRYTDNMPEWTAGIIPCN